jgi:hypothetical protein
MANRRYFGSIRRRESGRWQIRYCTRDGVRVAWPETYARRADAVRVLAERERQSQVAGNWLDVAGSKVLFAAYADEWINQHPRLGPRTADVYRSLIRRHIATTLGQIPLGSSTQPQCVSGAPGCSKAVCPRPWLLSRTACCARS